jgi:hypothetical protein
LKKFFALLLVLAMFANAVLPWVTTSLAIEWVKSEEKSTDDTDDDNLDEKTKQSKPLSFFQKLPAGLMAHVGQSIRPFHVDFMGIPMPYLRLPELPPEQRA